MPGQAPTKRVILNPDDAVQWALYYPAQVAWRDLPGRGFAGPAGAGFERLRAGDAAGRAAAVPGESGRRLVAHRRGRWRTSRSATRCSARTVAVRPARGRRLRATRKPSVTRSWRPWRSRPATSPRARRGDRRGASQRPGGGAPLVLLSTIELRQNHRDRRRAPRPSARSRRIPIRSARCVAASEAAQSRVRPGGRTRVPRPRDRRSTRATSVRWSTARASGSAPTTRAARARTRTAPQPSRPTIAQVRSLLGFIALADGDAARRGADFERGGAGRPELGEPHLGLGPRRLPRQPGQRRPARDADRDAARAEGLAVSELSRQGVLPGARVSRKASPRSRRPSVSTRATRRRGSTPASSSAIRTARSTRSTELRQAIALNDNRAVYRSRLLLDRDLATKNVSLAEIYRQLGFEAWGAFEALELARGRRHQRQRAPLPRARRTAAFPTGRRRSAASCSSTSSIRRSTGTRSTTSRSTRRCSSSRCAS